MNKQIVEEWIAALRSGEYKQGRSRLRAQNNEYCCLGVLCELAVKHGIIDRKSEGYGISGEFFQDVFELPYSVMTWAGLRDSAGAYNGDEPKALARLNDDGMPFKEIADIIESNPEGLFRKGE